MAPVRIDKWVACKAVLQTGPFVWSFDLDFSSEPVVSSSGDLAALASAIRANLNGLMGWATNNTSFLRVECVSNYPDPAINYAGTSSNTTPVLGTQTGEYMPGNVAANATVKSKVRARRSVGRGRLSYLPEASIVNGTLLSGAMTAIFNFLAVKLVGVSTGGITYIPVVASRKYHSLSASSGMTIDNLTDSTRARLVRP